MKRVDADYSYDELEGFAPLDVRKIAPKDELWLSMSGSKLSLSTAARAVLFVKPFLRFSYNAEKKLLLIAAAAASGADTAKLCVTSKNFISMRSLTRLMERECRYDLSVVRIRIPGSRLRSNANALVFDLRQVSAAKVKKQGK